MKYYVRKVIVLESFDLFVASKLFWIYIIINFFKTLSPLLVCVSVCVKILRLRLVTIFVFCGDQLPLEVLFRLNRLGHTMT